MAVKSQPPSGGCELKPRLIGMVEQSEGQPPSGGCELKLYWFVESVNLAYQPPSGGCELKHIRPVLIPMLCRPAAFGRL